MRAIDLFEKVGRDLQHIEDIIYIDGPDAAIGLIDRIRAIAERPDSLSVKWDGSPAIKFGRDDAGVFHFGDKFAKEPITSPKEMKAYYMAKVKGELEASRRQFIGKMARLHSVFERSTPESFRGYIHADLMWSDKLSLTDGTYIFAPNTVRYIVDASSALGQRIGNSKVGAAAIAYMETFDGPSQAIGNKWKAIEQGELLLLAPVYVRNRKTSIPENVLLDLERDIRRNANNIELFIEPEPGLADIRAIIYRFINQMAAKGKTMDLDNEFPAWIAENPKLSDKKKERIAQRIETNPEGFKATFRIVSMFSAIKKDIINDLEGPTLADVGIRAELVSGAPGGEGFVDAPKGKAPLKFVDRETFSMANFARGL